MPPPCARIAYKVGFAIRHDFHRQASLFPASPPGKRHRGILFMPAALVALPESVKSDFSKRQGIGNLVEGFKQICH